MDIRIYSPREQGVGQFDEGKITEQKPIGFPGEGSAVKRVGPLFYWAWAHAEQEGFIGSHPHQAFEIMTYVIQGSADHGDSLGTRQMVEAGGLQVIQAGSGVWHNERLIGPAFEGFQIWFEPYLNESIKMAPTYNQYPHEAFPQKYENGVTIKTIIGEGAPVHIVADARMWDIELEQGSRYTHQVKGHHALAVLATRGGGEVLQQSFAEKDFLVLVEETGNLSEVEFRTASGDGALRLTVIEVPYDPGYPLYPKR